MTEDDAKKWLAGSLHVPRETIGKLSLLARLVGGAQHNLIAPSTCEHMWVRHIADSAQLVPLTREHELQLSGEWFDLGSGAGFPGLVVALLTGFQTRLVEPRRLRAEFLEAAISTLGLQHSVQVLPCRVQAVSAEHASIISARAFAPLTEIFAAASHIADRETLWLLPKGRTAQAELEVARRSWQGEFSLAPSVTDPDAAIVVARDVRPRR